MFAVKAVAGGAVRKENSSDVDAGKNKRRNSITGSMVERFKPQTADEIREVITALQKEMQAETGGKSGGKKSLVETLGEALVKKSVKVPELVKQWSSSSKGVVNEANKVEFRKSVRATIEWPNVKDIDNLFTTVDTDGTGTVSSIALAKAINRMLDRARDAVTKADKIAARVAFFQSRIDSATEVANATATAEDADARLESITGNKSPEARLGAELLRRNAKMVDIMKAFESTAGAVDRKQFRKGVRTFGVNDEDQALDALFDSLDDDGGGTLDNEELKAALSVLRDASVESDREVERLKKKSVELWKAAKMSQLELKKQRKADELAAQAEKEQEAKDAEERTAAAEAAQQALMVKKAEEARRKEEESSAYEAKIAQRRASVAGGLGAVKVVNGKVVKA